MIKIKLSATNRIFNLVITLIIPFFGTISGTSSIYAVGNHGNKVLEELRPGVVYSTAVTKNATYGGTGSIINSSGIVVTNRHVIEGASCKTITVLVSGNKRYPCKKIIYIFPDDPVYTDVDLAIIQFAIPSNEISIVPLAPNDPEQGDDVFALGFPNGYGLTFNRGVVSIVNLEHKPAYLMHDSPINEGNSGGPLANDRGQIVGMNTYGLQDRQNQNLALKVSIIKFFLDQLNISYSTNEVVSAPVPEVVVETKYVDRVVEVPKVVVETRYVERRVAPTTTYTYSPPTSFQSGIFSRFVIGRGDLLSEKNVDDKTTSKQESENSEPERETRTIGSNLEAGHWDMIGYRNNSRFDFVLFTGSIVHESTVGSRSMESLAGQLGARIDIYPIQRYWTDWLGTQLFIGLGYCAFDLETFDQNDDSYSYTLSGTGPTATTGLDIFLGKYIGLSVAWNGFAAFIDRQSTSNKAKGELASLQKELNREPVFYGSSLGVGITLNLPL